VALTTGLCISTKGISLLLLLLYNKIKQHALPELSASCYQLLVDITVIHMAAYMVLVKTKSLAFRLTVQIIHFNQQSVSVYSEETCFI
jgi:hypothetical protein